MPRRRARRRPARLLAPRVALLVLLSTVAALSVAAPARAQRAGGWNPFGGGGGGGRWRGVGGGGGQWRGGDGDTTSSSNNSNDDDPGVGLVDDAFGGAAVGASVIVFPGGGGGGGASVPWSSPPPPPPFLPPPPQSPPQPPASSRAPPASPSPRPAPNNGGAASEAEALLRAASQPVGTTMITTSSLAGGTTGAAQAGAGLATDALAAAADAGAPPPGAELVAGTFPPPARGAFGGGAEEPGGGSGGAITPRGGGSPVPTSALAQAPFGGGEGTALVPSSCSDLWDCISRAPALQLLRRWVEVAQFRDALPKCSGSSVTLAGKPIGAATLFATADSWFYGFNCAGLDFTPLFPVPFGTEADGKVYAARNFVLGGLIPGARVAFSWAERDKPKSARTYAGNAVSYKMTSSGDKLVEWTTGLGVRFQARVLASVVPSGCGGKVALHVVSKPVAPPSSFETQLASGGDALGAGRPPDPAKLSSLSQAVASEPSTRLYFAQLAATGQLDALPKCVAGGRGVAYGGAVSSGGGATIFVPRDAFFYGVSCWALNFSPLQRLFRENPAARAFAQSNFVASGIVPDQALRPSAFTGSPRRARTAAGGEVAIFRDGASGALKVAWENARPGAVREARVLRTIVPGGCTDTVMYVVDVAVAPKGSLVVGGRKKRRRRA